MTVYDALRALPSVDCLLQQDGFAALFAVHGRAVVVEAARAALEQARRTLLKQDAQSEASVLPQHVSDEALLQAATAWIAAHVSPTLQPVINASGVVLHTNLGRAPLSAAVLQAMSQVGIGYSNLEFDLAEGRRGSRYMHAEELLCRLTGAEAAVLVNNNAGAVLLVLSALASGKHVIVSRGQLVEIGGGFRIPEVMAQSGALLVEVGTTNRTYVQDYARAVDDATVAYMRVHTSNFAQTGFVHQASLAELVQSAHERNLLVLDDLGSGTLLDTAAYGLAHEPTVQESVTAGADIVTFSGDKLLGGPQAGIIVGRRDLLSTIRRHPLIRALRVDKATIAGVQANLLHYLRGQAETEIPVWRMITMSRDEISARAAALVMAMPEGVATTIEGRSMIGGGSLPEQSLPTTLVGIATGDPDGLAARLRQGCPAVVARVQEGRVLLDLRTVFPAQDALLTTRLREVLS